MAVLPPDPIFNLRQSEMGAVNCICFHNTERLYCGTAKGVVYLWDLATNRSPLHFSIGCEPATSIYHGDDFLITQQKGGIVKKWSIGNGGFDLDISDNLEHIGFCRFQYDASNDLLITPKDTNEISISKLNDGDNERTVLDPKIALNDTKTDASKLGGIMCLRPIALSSQSYILAGYESGIFLTWDLRTNNVINVAQFEECPIAFDYCSETNRGIYGNTSNKLGIFGYQRNEMKLLQRGDIVVKNAGINCVQIRKDRKIFCSGGADGRVRIFSWKSLRPLAVLTEHTAAINDIAYSNGVVELWKSQIMATASNDGQISLWNLYNN